MTGGPEIREPKAAMLSRLYGHPVQQLCLGEHTALLCCLVCALFCLMYFSESGYIMTFKQGVVIAQKKILTVTAVS